MTTHTSVIYPSLLADDMNLKSIPCEKGRQKGPGVIEPIALIYLAVILTWSILADLGRSVFLISN